MIQFKVVSECNHNEVWALFDNKERAQTKVNAKYWHKYMYDKDKHKTLIVIPAQ